jgi:hypothetical protein
LFPLMRGILELFYHGENSINSKFLGHRKVIQTTNFLHTKNSSRNSKKSFLEKQPASDEVIWVSRDVIYGEGSTREEKYCFRK